MADDAHFSKPDLTVFAILVALAVAAAIASIAFALLSTVYR
jgi:NADH:ubiquinone oxidoreductase subunit K